VSAPVVLFDGVCNLCHAAVAWILEHDREGVFRFASLQSAAARDVLASSGAGDLPDSVVLVDEAGVHTRSDAAIRIARRLGFPWSLLVLAKPLPGFLRNAIYAWIARNRYRWFGRRDTCGVPSPELASRFLDAAETIEVPPPAAAAPPMGLSYLELLLYSYLWIYIFPFPLSGVPGAESFTGRYDEFWQKVIQWVAARILRVDASILPGGSGDTTYNYVETFLDASLAVFLALAAWVWMRGKPGGPIRGGIRVYVRYSLGAVMLSYGWHKLFPLQMMQPGPDRLVNALADTSPMGLLWTFIGLSPAYQMLCGFVEVLGGALLLFRRTTPLGALLTAGAMAQVVALNFCYDVPVKLFSSHLLGSAIFLLAPYLPGLMAYLLGLPARPVPVVAADITRPWPRRLRVVAKLVAIGVFAVLPVYLSYLMLKQRYDLDLGPLHGLYAVDTFQVTPADKVVSRWVRVGINGAYHGVAIAAADGKVRRYGFLLDAAKGSLTLQAGKDQRIPLRYRKTGPDSVLIEGLYDGATVQVSLKRQPALLTSRGFHWVNERPFNR
jgi:predicted DCC family thiol-disulfide oxidoreductase YuxK/uncharacterized membrane protein YphA (DoxX/SURF4 family)